MSNLQQLLDSNTSVVLDGGMGTMLIEAGLESGSSPELWNIEHPEQIKAIHRGYIQAGAQIILTNSFGGNSFRLKLHNLQDRVTELNKAAAALACAEAEQADHPVAVAGSIGPTGEMLAPMGLMTVEEAKAAFAEQASALVEGGVELLWVETMSDLKEAQAAIEGIRSVCDLPIVATMTFDTHGRTMMGVKPVQALNVFKQFNLLAIGANCGNGPAEIEAVIEAMHQEDPSVRLVAKSNAGIPHWEGADLVYDGTPEVMATYAHRVQGLGASMVGACCGSTPAHVQAIATALAAK